MKHLNILKKSLSCNEIWAKQMPSEASYVSHTSNNNDQHVGGIDSGASALAASKRHKSSDKLAKPKTENHKTVIYFGDSISSKKQHSQLQQQMKAQQNAANWPRNNGGGDDSGLNDQPSDLKHAQRLCDEMVFKRQQQPDDSRNPNANANEAHSKCATAIVNDVKVIGANSSSNSNGGKDSGHENVNIVKHLKSVIEEKCQSTKVGDKSSPMAPEPVRKSSNCSDKNPMALISIDGNARDGLNATSVEVGNRKLPSFVESVVNGVINIKIDDSYDAATKLVRSLECADTDDTDSFDAMDDGNDLFLDVGGEVNNMYLDWSFVQDWRSRPSGNTRDVPLFTAYVSPNPNSSLSVPCNTNANVNGSPSNGMNASVVMSPQSSLTANMNQSIRVHSPATATPAMGAPKEVAYRPKGTTDQKPLNELSPMTPTHMAGNASIVTNASTITMSPKSVDTVDGTMSHGGNSNATTCLIGSSSNVTNLTNLSTMIPERDTNNHSMAATAAASAAAAAAAAAAQAANIKMKSMNCKSIPHRPIAGPAKLTIQSIPVKSQPPMLSSNLSNQRKTIHTNFNENQMINGIGHVQHNNLNNNMNNSVAGGGGGGGAAMTAVKSTPMGGAPSTETSQNLLNQQKSTIIMRTHHHGGTNELVRGLQRVQECHSSSDENRSSGHASMSDTGHGSSSPGCALGPLPEDRLAAGVTNRSTRSSTSAGHARARHRSTPAKGPWNGNGGLEDIKLAIQQLTMRSQTSTSTYSSLSAGSEMEPRRLGRYSSLETVNTNVTSADEFVWIDSHNRLVELQHPPWTQHCLVRVIRTGRHAERISLETIPRLGYLLQRALVRVAREIQRLSIGLGLCSKHEVAAAFSIILCPALADSCIKACLRAAAMFGVPGDSSLRQSKSSRAGLQLSVGRFHRWMSDARLGRFVHEYAAVYLCAGLENLLEEIILQCMPSDPSVSLTASGLEHSIASSGDLWGLLQPYAHLNAGRIASGALTMPRWASQSSIGSNIPTNSSMEPCLLTTCVGSVAELKDLVLRAQNKFNHLSLSHTALVALFYFMRCSQLEHNEESNNTSNGNSSVQELCYERAYVVLPPLVEWLRVASAHAEYRHSLIIDSDDIMQAARLLLPGVDCSPRAVGADEELPPKRSAFSMKPQSPTHQVQPSNPNIHAIDDNEYARRATIALAFRLMLTGRPELLIQAGTLLPSSSRYDTLNQAGMTALMIASNRNDELAIQQLLDANADPNIEVPSIGASTCSAIHPETQHWTAITFAACRGNYNAVRMLLERGANVEGGACLSNDKCTLTPLQVSSGSGSVDIVSLLLSYGANAFLSTMDKDSLCFTGSAQRGCYSAISVAAAHDQRATLRKLLSHPLAPVSREVLSLEEMLAEGDNNARHPNGDRPNEITPSMTKTQIKCLQEAMYHSAENNHLDITIELRALGVPWTLHCWMHALSAAHELRLDSVIDQLLQDFLQVCPDDYSSQFVTECLPLLFNIFRYSKKEGTTLLLADIFATCFGWEPIKPVQELAPQPANGSRIDPKFVNNPELSDVMFRVEGKIFYGHKIVLVTASPRFQSMLSSKLSDGNTPTVQINDIRYHIFQLVMQFLYSGGCNSFDVVAPGDILELMAAASFFQLEDLLRYTEARCSQMIDIDNVVAMYIHAKVYNAPKLIEFCYGFLLQNMVALLTYDDSVKRLLFAKKIPNNDVLNGLLQTLQSRIKQRRSVQNPGIRPTPVMASSANKIVNNKP